MTTQETDLAVAEPRDAAGSSSTGVTPRRLMDLVKQPFYWLYEKRLLSKVNDWVLPQHIGIIMDGNRRYARSLGLPHVSHGHNRGAERLWDVLNWCYEVGVPVVTVWSFSLENFERDTGEVEALLELFEEKTREIAEHDDVHRHEIRVRYLGEIGLLPESLQEAIQHAEEATAKYSKYQLNIAMAYGGRQEITEAFRSYLRDEASRGLSMDEIVEKLDKSSIEPYLYTYGQPEPDLILRTSGEVRLSGFLLWQSAYAEYYFCDANWPALRKIDLLRALRSYAGRQRRLGR